ncbi:TATA-binding protein-associated phosphoprotein [Entamoeba marina]
MTTVLKLCESKESLLPKRSKRTPCEDAFKKMRNYQVFQQAIFIALLSQFFEVTVKSPVKRSIVSLQLLRVDSLNYGNDTILVDEFVNTRCKEKYKQDILNGISEKTAKRRSDTNRITEQLHFLRDILMLFGFDFYSKFTEGKNGAQIVETVLKVIGNGSSFNRNDISLKGKEINDYLYSKLVDCSSATLPMKDETIFRLLSTT